MKLTLGIAILFVNSLGVFGGAKMIIQHPKVLDYFKESCPHYEYWQGDHFSEKRRHRTKSQLCIETAGFVSFTFVRVANPLPKYEMHPSILHGIHQTMTQPNRVTFVDSEKKADEYFVLLPPDLGNIGNTIDLVQEIAQTDTKADKRQALEASFLASHTDGKNEGELNRLFREGTPAPGETIVRHHSASVQAEERGEKGKVIFEFLGADEMSLNISRLSLNSPPKKGYGLARWSVGVRETSLSRCAMDAFTRFRLCSSIFPIWMVYKKKQLPRVNYLREGNADCVKMANIIFESFYGMSPEPLLVHNLIPCAVNTEWSEAQFYISADIRSQNEAFIMEAFSWDPIIPEFFIRMHVKNLIY